MPIAQLERGEIGGGELAEFQDRAALDAIRLYEDTGIDVITDGEMRRKAWFDPLTDSLSGYTTKVSAPVPFSRGAGQAADAPPVLPVPTQTLGMRHNLPLEEVSFVREHSREAGQGDDAGNDLRERAVRARPIGRCLPRPGRLHGGRTAR